MSANVVLDNRKTEVVFEAKRLPREHLESRILNGCFFLSVPQMVTRTKKIFVGGLSAPTTLEDVKNYFEQFGPVSTDLEGIATLLLTLRESGGQKSNLNHVRLILP